MNNGVPQASFPRSEEALIVAIMRRDPEHAPIYHRRDLNGDGIPETMCNWFIRDICGDLSAPVPNVRARDQILWISGTLGRLEGWKRGTIESARVAAGQGLIVVVSWLNPVATQSSHVALMRDAQGNIAQAGRTNFNKGTIAQGFGALVVDFHIHP